MMAGSLPSLVLGGLGDLDLLGRLSLEPSAFREPTLVNFSFEKVLFK